MTEPQQLTGKNEEEALPANNPFAILKLSWTLVKSLFKEKTEIIMLSSIVLLLLWGYHGNLDLLQLVIKDWSPPGENTGTRQPILHWILWDREFISFFAGAFLVVFIPALIIKFGFKHSLKDYGLAFPSREKRSAGLVLFLTLLLALLYPFYIASKDAGMQHVYPFYKSFTSIPQFILYEASYFPFFLAIEFIFRGYLLLGLSHNSGVVNSSDTDKSTIYNFGKYAIAISMLSYTAWHLGKPLAELWGTPVWGLLAGAGTYYIRSIWPVLMAHFLLNVFLDAMILHNLHQFPF